MPTVILIFNQPVDKSLTGIISSLGFVYRTIGQYKNIPGNTFIIQHNYMIAQMFSNVNGLFVNFGLPSSAIFSNIV